MAQPEEKKTILKQMFDMDYKTVHQEQEEILSELHCLRTGFDELKENQKQTQETLQQLFQVVKSVYQVADVEDDAVIDARTIVQVLGEMPTSEGAIASETRMDPENIAAALKYMDEMGYVTKMKLSIFSADDDDDEYSYVLTDAGYQFLCDCNENPE